MSMTTIRTTYRRRGISLLEVLVSIGVLSIGLLGVLALMPAASNQAKIGAQQDAAAILGRRAFREMNVRWYGQSIGAAATDQFFCLDPVGSILVNEAPTAPTTPLANLASANRIGVPMGPLQVNEVFHSTDDLSFGDVGSGENPAPNPPQQVALKDDSGAPIKRFAEGNLSWFATVVRHNTGFSTYSIAIVNKRAPGTEFLCPTAAVDNSTPSSPPNIIVNTSGGIGQIDLLKSQSQAKAWDDVKSGQWILLVSADSTTPFDPNVGKAEWYRVQGNGEFTDAMGNEYRSYAVAGANWTEPVDNPAMTSTKTFAILVPNVVAVYSRNLPTTQ